MLYINRFSRVSISYSLPIYPLLGLSSNNLLYFVLVPLFLLNCLLNYLLLIGANIYFLFLTYLFFLSSILFPLLYHYLEYLYNHYAASGINEKAVDIDLRFDDNKEKAHKMLENLRDSLKFFQYLQDCAEIREWLDAKHTQAQDDTYRDSKNIHMKYLRHKGFEAEIDAN
jgi:hypothetical protein